MLNKYKTEYLLFEINIFYDFLIFIIYCVTVVSVAINIFGRNKNIILKNIFVKCDAEFIVRKDALRQGRVSSVVEHFTRNEGVAGSNPVLAF